MTANRSLFSFGRGHLLPMVIGCAAMTGAMTMWMAVARDERASPNHGRDESHRAEHEPTAGVARQPSSVAEGAARGQAPADEARSPIEHAARVRPAPPASVSEWYRWSASQRLDFVTEAGLDPHLPTEVVAFFRLAIQDRQLDALTRNNTSNALIAQKQRDPGLAAIFRAMSEDPTEDVEWRDYALQFLAACIDWSSDPADMAFAIWRQAESSRGATAGTALLHLHHIDERGVVPVPDGYGARLRKLLGDPTADLATRVTVAGIIGQRHMTDCAPLLRALVDQAGDPALRRTSLAALGVMGDKTSFALAERLATDPDPLLAAAARGASQSLARTAPNDPSETGPKVEVP